ncbi:hypothetical protein RRG08_008058 [Elysia crispata]|uniref:Uncharacterized protein n=1 Tax=Elysia crispata TaxID=231223 RepID=A0AAE0YXT3_9GAST|nr:hypothetical protein RRG08_008058 [Elysia crispata]
MSIATFSVTSRLRGRDRGSSDLIRALETRGRTALAVKRLGISAYLDYQYFNPVTGDWQSQPVVSWAFYQPINQPIDRQAVLWFQTSERDVITASRYLPRPWRLRAWVLSGPCWHCYIRNH